MIALFPLLLVGGGLAALALSQSKKIAPAPTPSNPVAAGPINGDALPKSVKAEVVRAVEFEASPTELEKTSQKLAAQATKQRDPVQKSELEKAAALTAKKASDIRRATDTAGKQTVAVETQKRELPPELFQTMTAAIKEGSAEALSAAAYTLRSAGFRVQADRLEAMARVARAATPPPNKVEKVIPKEPALDPTLKATAARALQSEGDPVKLDALAKKLQSVAPQLADQLRSKANSIREAIATKSEVQAVQKALAPDPLATMRSKVKAAEPKLPSNLVEQVATILVRAPKADPKVAAVQLANLSSEYASRGFPGAARMLMTAAKGFGYKPPAVKPKSKQHVAAERLTAHLRSHPRGRENKALVGDTQAILGLGRDGLYGADTATALAAFVVPVKPYYWPKNGAAQRLARFRNDILSITSKSADAAHASGLRALANDPRLGFPPVD